MRKLFLFTTLSLLLAACKKERMQQAAENPVTKKIEFHVHAEEDYGPGFEAITAEVKLAVYKINYRNGDAQKLWDTTFTSRSVQQYPVLPGKHVMEKIIPVLESREKIQANFNIIYRQYGNIWQEGAADECIPGQQFLFLDVGI